MRNEGRGTRREEGNRQLADLARAPLVLSFLIPLSFSSPVPYLPSLLLAQQTAPTVTGLRFSVSFPRERSGTALDGRILLLISTDSSAEPRFQISDAATTQLVFGVNVDGM